MADHRTVGSLHWGLTAVEEGLAAGRAVGGGRGPLAIRAAVGRDQMSPALRAPLFPFSLVSALVLDFFCSPL